MPSGTSPLVLNYFCCDCKGGKWICSAWKNNAWCKVVFFFIFFFYFFFNISGTGFSSGHKGSVCVCELIVNDAPPPIKVAPCQIAAVNPYVSLHVIIYAVKIIVIGNNHNRSSARDTSGSKITFKHRK